MSNEQEKIWKDGRIIYYHYTADQNFWDAHWNNIITKEYYKKYERGEMDEYHDSFEKYLHKEDTILEAGCGAGRYIVAFIARGYKHIEGIDWGKPTIDKVKAIYPDLPVKVGDATKIDAPDNFYDGYISLGVVEHREQGPEPYLNEAYRVLRPGGYAFFSVPYVNPLRKLKGRLGFYKSKTNIDKTFYQYAYGKHEFSQFLKNASFEIIESRGIAGYFGLKEELRPVLSILNNIRGGWRIEQLLSRQDWINIWGHMILFTCKKPL